MVVNALFAAIPGIANVLLVSLLFWLIFSILGVQLFAGQFYKCIDNDWNRIEASIVPNKTACLNHSDGYRWVNAKLNFDDVINGFVSLFQVVSVVLCNDLRLHYSISHATLNRTCFPVLGPCCQPAHQSKT